MVTAELAMCLPVLVIIVSVALAAVSVGGQRVRAQDAATSVARALARGDSAAAQRLFAATGPPGASLSTTSSGDEVRVSVRLSVRPLGGWLGTYTIEETAVAQPEPAAPSAATAVSP